MASNNEFVAALAGAFAGAGAAFLLNVFHEVVKERNRKQAAIIQAQFALRHQLRALEGIKGRLNEHRKSVGLKRALDLPGMLWVGASVRLDLNSLAFVFHSSKPDVLGEAFDAEMSYQRVEALVMARNAFISDLDKVSKPSEFDIQAVSGTFEVNDTNRVELARLIRCTDQLYANFDDAYRRLITAIEDLYTVGRELLFEKKFIRLSGKITPPGEQALI
jgi:hypothetical protein